MNCSECGKENIDNAKFCAHCGKELKVQIKKREIIMRVIAFLAGVVVCLIVVASIGRGKSVYSKSVYKIEDISVRDITGLSEYKINVEASMVYEKFLNGEIPVYYISAENLSKSEYYITDFISSKEIRLQYCYIYPQMGNKKWLVLEVGKYTDYDVPYELENYVIGIKEGELVVSGGFTSLWAHNSATLNLYGVIKNYASNFHEKYKNATYYIDENGTIQEINSFISVGIFDEGGLHGINEFAGEGTERIIKDVLFEWNQVYHYGTDGCYGLSFEEYYLDKAYYVPSLYNCDESADEFIKLCQEKGMVFVSEEQITQMIEERKLSIGDREMFGEVYPEWFEWSK